jgi:hypothetical protein
VEVFAEELADGVARNGFWVHEREMGCIEGGACQRSNAGEAVLEKNPVVYGGLWARAAEIVHGFCVSDCCDLAKLETG